MTIAEAVEALAKHNYESNYSGEWENCPEQAKPGWVKEAQGTVDFLSAAGFGLVADAKAEALEDAADEMARLKAVGRKPYAECTEDEKADYYPYIDGSKEQWLRARATAVRAASA